MTDDEFKDLMQQVVISKYVDKNPLTTVSAVLGAMTNSSYTISNSMSESTEYAIQGKMLVVTDTLDHLQSIQADPNFIKSQMMQKMAQELYRSGMVEFTSQLDHVTGAQIYRARVFATPNSQVQILRKAGL